MCAAILALEAVALFLTGVVSIGTTDLGAGASLGLGLGLAVLCVLAAGLLGRPGGYVVGWGVQVVAVALGFVVTAMFFLGAVFAGLWAAAYFVGLKIERERAEREQQQAAWEARGGDASPDNR
jgi:hypothetical protein